MPRLSVEQVRRLMVKTDDIRLVSVIGSHAHGKTALAASLVCRAGIALAEQSRLDEQEQGMTIKSSVAPLGFALDGEDGKSGHQHLIHLIDSPGHADFAPEVTAALRVTDGAVVVVDCIEGCAVRTEALLRQVLAEHVKPLVFVNKVDRCMLELRMQPEDMFCRFRRSVEDVNAVVATYADALLGDVQVSAEQGTVAFGSALQGWGFTIESFAKIYAAKTGVDRDKMRKRLWGEHFFDPKKRVWTSAALPAGAAEPLQRGFCQLIISPLAQLVRAIMDNDAEKYEKMLGALGVALRGEDMKLTGMALMKRAMQTWSNAAETLLAMIVAKLPSPATAQEYRVEALYEGPMNDKAANAIRACNASGPLMMYVSKMVPNEGHFYAFGRVFSGTVATGQRVRIQSQGYKVGRKEQLDVRSIQQTLLPLQGRSAEQITDVPCGNLVAVAGVDGCLHGTATVTSLEDAHNFADLKCSVSQLVKVVVKPAEARDLPKLVEGLRKLSKSDLSVACLVEESGQSVVAACGELHLETCLRDLQETYAQCDVCVSDPGVSYCETVTQMSSQTCTADSPNWNRLHRICLQAEPLPEALCRAVEAGQAGPKADAKKRASLLCEKFGWDQGHACKIWCWGPEYEGANVVVDNTPRVVQDFDEMKESVSFGFQWATKEGPLCEERMRGIRFNIVDARVPVAYPWLRSGNQMLYCARRCFLAAELASKPALQEPVLLVEIWCPQEALSCVRSCMSLRRGRVLEENPQAGTSAVQVKAFLPAAESFGLASVLREETGGRAALQCAFDHWDVMPGDCTEAGSEMQEFALALRRRKQLQVKMPVLSDFVDMPVLSDKID